MSCFVHPAGYLWALQTRAIENIVWDRFADTNYSGPPAEATFWITETMLQIMEQIYKNTMQQVPSSYIYIYSSWMMKQFSYYNKYSFT